MNRSLVTVLLCVSTLAISQVPSHAWNKSGHMVTGAIAYERLKATDPQALATCLTLFNSHTTLIKRGTKSVPTIEFWNQEATSSGLQGEDRDRFFFMMAARWADDARGTKEQHRETWHYVNYKFDPTISTKNPPKLPLKEPGPDILESYQKNTEIITSSEASDAEKAVALCWILHQIGDSHQPLHSVARVKPGTNQGDSGGNYCFTRVLQGGDGLNNGTGSHAGQRETINLHRFWDGLVTSSEKYQTMRNISTLLRNNHPIDSFPAIHANPTMAKWVLNESYPLAVVYAYNNGKMKYASVAKQAKDAPEGYEAAAGEVGKARATLAGYRMGLEIRRLLAPDLSPIALTFVPPVSNPLGMMSSVSALRSGQAGGANLNSILTVRRQNFRVKLVLRKDFIEKYKNRVLLETPQFSFKASGGGPNGNDGDIHASGTSSDIGFATVVEIMNAKNSLAGQQAFKSSVSQPPVPITGVWRLWAEHGTGTFQQNSVSSFSNPNPNHAFELHPVTRVKGVNTASTIDFLLKSDAMKSTGPAFNDYLNYPYEVVDNGATVSVNTSSHGFNHVKFKAKLLSTAINADDSGKFVFAEVQDNTGKVLLPKVRLALVPGSSAFLILANASAGSTFSVVGIPRISLRLISLQLSGTPDADEMAGRSGKLPFELVIVGVRN
jgi:hypothetical protein